MVIGVTRRASRPAARGRLVLALVVAALVHVLGCAHGSPSDGAHRIDSLPVTTTTAVSQPAGPAPGLRAVADAAPTGTGAPAIAGRGLAGMEECQGADEPSTLSPRTLLPQPPPGAATDDPGTGSKEAVVRPAAHELMRAGGGKDQHTTQARTRAVLGVWRS
ncbi:hypothetical protein [Streptomyces sp. NPDC048650]|uniref:hypothetical protein n=1 Tax=unclassified Streptomyces TaxID=2593676 RepID=UPI00370FA743